MLSLSIVITTIKQSSVHNSANNEYAMLLQRVFVMLS